MTNRLFSDDVPAERSAKAAAEKLTVCYEMLASDKFDHACMSSNCRQRCLLCVALGDSSPGNNWRQKPKLHMFQELCEFTKSRPSSTWCYRDEDFGGSLGSTSKRRGGKHTVFANAACVLDKFMAKHKIPIFL